MACRRGVLIAGNCRQRLQPGKRQPRGSGKARHAHLPCLATPLSCSSRKCQPGRNIEFLLLQSCVWSGCGVGRRGPDRWAAPHEYRDSTGGVTIAPAVKCHPTRWLEPTRIAICSDSSLLLVARSAYAGGEQARCIRLVLGIILGHWDNGAGVDTRTCFTPSPHVIQYDIRYGIQNGISQGKHSGGFIPGSYLTAEARRPVFAIQGRDVIKVECERTPTGLFSNTGKQPTSRTITAQHRGLPRSRSFGRKLGWMPRLMTRQNSRLADSVLGSYGRAPGAWYTILPLARPFGISDPLPASPLSPSRSPLLCPFVIAAASAAVAAV